MKLRLPQKQGIYWPAEKPVASKKDSLPHIFYNRLNLMGLGAVNVVDYIQLNLKAFDDGVTECLRLFTSALSTGLFFLT
jgi:hypothetical protein